jgi:hypothetical protein
MMMRATEARDCGAPSAPTRPLAPTHTLHRNYQPSTMGTFRRRVCDTSLNYAEAQIDSIRPCSRSVPGLDS